MVVSRFNGEISNRLLESALEALNAAGVADERITVMPVPGAFELPIGAMALAKTRRYSCVIALGCVVRGETAHFEYVAGEAASGLQLAGLETGVPVAFGVLTVDTAEQAEARVDKGADAARAALEMADLFSQVAAPATTRGQSRPSRGQVRSRRGKPNPVSERAAGLIRPCPGAWHQDVPRGDSCGEVARPRSGYPGRLMSKVCAICGKKPGFGNHRSHSMVASKRRFEPNLQRVRVLLKGKATRAYVCTRCLKAGKVQKAL